MTDKNKNKEKSKMSKKRETVSTFSNMLDQQIENQKKIIKNLFGSSNIMADRLSYLCRIDHDRRLLGLPSQLELEEFSRRIENPLLDFDELEQIEETIPDYLLNALENSKYILDSQYLFESLLSIDKEELIRLEGMLLDLRIDDVERSLSDYRTLNFEIKEFKPVKPAYNEFILITRTRENIEIGDIKLRTVQDTQLQVQSLKVDLKEIKETIIQDAKNKDEMLEELLDYFKNGGSNTVKVTKVKYNKKTAELSINKQTINIRADTNEHYLCKLLFANKENIKKVWEVYDIIEAWGENTEILDVWIKVIYNTIRRLNEKIQLSTGLERFILYENKTVLVNPNYLTLS